MPISRLNTAFRSMKVEIDKMSQASAAADHATLYTVADYSGAGILTLIGQRVATGGGICAYIEATLDNGTAETSEFQTTGTHTTIARVPEGVVLNFNAEFSSALKVRIANNHATNAYNIHGLVTYQHLSEEIRREIIEANQPLPNRDYTYPFDVLVVYYATGGSSIKFLSSAQLITSFDSQGKLQGKMIQPVYNTAALGVAGKDYNPTAPKFSVQDLVEDGTVDVVLSDLDGYPGAHTFKVPIVKGVIDNTYLPSKSLTVKVDATK